MAYLESKKLVHRDLAARNILINDLNQAKVRMTPVRGKELARLTSIQRLFIAEAVHTPTSHDKFLGCFFGQITKLFQLMDWWYLSVCLSIYLILIFYLTFVYKLFLVKAEW